MWSPGKVQSCQAGDPPHCAGTSTEPTGTAMIVPKRAETSPAEDDIHGRGREGGGIKKFETGVIQGFLPYRGGSKEDILRVYVQSAR